MSVGLARREIRARPGRFAWLVVAVTVAVGFTVGAFGFSTSLSALLDPSATGADALDVVPQGSVVLTADTSAVTSATALDEGLLATVRAVPGVAVAEGSYDQPIAFRLAPGAQPERPVILRGVVLSSTFTPEHWRVVEGAPPSGPREIAVDAGGLAVGQTAVGSDAVIEYPTGALDVRVVGVVVPEGGGAIGDPAPGPVALAAAHAVLDPAVAPLLLDAVGRVDRVTVAPLPGVEPDALADRIEARVPEGVRVQATLGRAAVTQHTVERIDDGVQRAVTAFAVLTVLVSSLVVANTLSVLVAQRTREFGLLRLVGASRRQILGMVMTESLGVGAVGAVLGLGLGVVLAYVAARVVRDSTVPVGFAVTPLMVVVALGVGVVVTSVGGIVPAVRAGAVAPMAALSDTRAGADRRSHGAGPLAAIVVGVAATLYAVTRPGGASGPMLVVAGVGVLAVFVGVAGISRWIVRPVLALASTAIGLSGSLSGRLGAVNARRSPGRTAGAASTLMVGLAFVGVVATVGASVRTTVATQFDTASRADLYLERRGVVRVSTGALEADLLRRLSRRRGPADWAAITSVDGVVVGRRGATDNLAASDLADLDRLVDLGVSAGAIRPDRRFGADPAGVPPPVILSRSAAERLGASPGDDVTLRSVSGHDLPLRVAAVYTNTAIAGDAVVDRSSGLDPSVLGTFELGLLRFDGRVPVRRVTSIAGHYPKVRVHTPAEFGALNAAVTDTVLRILGVVLVGMVGIGYLGLVATLGLATLERRRELVMLRAVGATRAQVRSMVLTEATLVGLVAAVVGLGVGVAAGRLVAAAAPDDLVAGVVVPWSLLALVAVGSVGLAALVSVGVGRRAGLVPPAEAGRD